MLVMEPWTLSATLLCSHTLLLCLVPLPSPHPAPPPPSQAGATKESKAKWRFLQKYWHKGAFFQEAPDDARGTAGTHEVFARDYSAPTGEDKFDKSLLPSVMQVGGVGTVGGVWCRGHMWRVVQAWSIKVVCHMRCPLPTGGVVGLNSQAYWHTRLLHLTA